MCSSRRLNFKKVHLRLPVWVFPRVFNSGCVGLKVRQVIRWFLLHKGDTGLNFVEVSIFFKTLEKLRSVEENMLFKKLKHIYPRI